MSDPMTVEMWRGLRGEALVSALMNAPWFAMEDDVIGGWCVMPSPLPPSSCVPAVGSFLGEAVAKHVAKTHNRWLEIQDALRRADAALAELAEEGDPDVDGDDGCCP